MVMEAGMSKVGRMGQQAGDHGRADAAVPV